MNFRLKIRLIFEIGKIYIIMQLISKWNVKIHKFENFMKQILCSRWRKIVDTWKVFIKQTCESVRYLHPWYVKAFRIRLSWSVCTLLNLRFNNFENTESLYNIGKVITHSHLRIIFQNFAILNISHSSTLFETGVFEVNEFLSRISLRNWDVSSKVLNNLLININS